MAISIVTSQYSESAGNTSSVTATAPSGITDGDFLLCVLAADSGDGLQATFTIPSGWTEVYNQFSNYDSAVWGIFWKVASSESGSYTFSHNRATGAGGVTVTIFRMTGVHATLGINTVSDTKSANGITSPWTVSAPSITPTVDNCLVWWIGTVDDNGGGNVTMAIPVGYSAVTSWQGTTGSTWSHVDIGSIQQTTAAATGEQHATFSEVGQAACIVGIHMAIRPAAGGGGGFTWQQLISMERPLSRIRKTVSY